MPRYDKLIRDGIPTILTDQGLTFIVETYAPAQFRAALRAKLDEEVGEFLDAADDNAALEELADILEVVSALATEYGADLPIVERIRGEKAAARGTFTRQLRLIETSERSDRRS